MDAEQDPETKCESLAHAIRHAYNLEGIRIEINLDHLRPRKGRRSKPVSTVVGRIQYPSRGASLEESDIGWLIYFKASDLTGNAPAAVQSYRVQHPEFPHEPEAEWNLTETQYESYRSLGEFQVMRWARELLETDFRGEFAEKSGDALGVLQTWCQENFDSQRP